MMKLSFRIVTNSNKDKQMVKGWDKQFEPQGIGFRFDNRDTLYRKKL